jgi:hypothetical protein
MNRKTLVKSMQNKDTTDWQLLGQLELPVASNADDPTRIWLMEILGPLNLPVDFLNKILKSTQDSATRVMQAEFLIKFEHIHLFIFVPSAHTSRGRTWGFFRIEKIEKVTADDGPPAHAIEFYLYLEG